MSDLYRWTKQVAPDDLDHWETELLIADVTYTAEKPVNRKTWQLASYSDTRESAEALKARFGGGVTRVLPDSWQHSTGDEAHTAIKIRDRFVITGASTPEDLERVRGEHPDREILSFPPRLAFGTGEHPTTANCMRFLVDAARERPAGERWPFLDVGCGSGIFAIAARLLGAGETDAIEFDLPALEVAVENGRRHDVDGIDWIGEDALAWLRDRDPAATPYPVVAANLFSSLLVQMFPLLSPHLAPGATVIVSGFLTSQTKEVVAAAAEAGVELTEFARRGKWVAAMGKSR